MDDLRLCTSKLVNQDLMKDNNNFKDNYIWYNLPNAYTYCEKQVHGNEFTFRIKEVTDKDECQKWIDELSNINEISWKVRKTFPNSGRIYIYAIDLRCEYNTDKRRSGERSTKNTDCPAILIIRIKRYMKKSYAKIPDILSADFPAVITFRNYHNHTINTENTLKCRDLTDVGEMVVVDPSTGMDKEIHKVYFLVTSAADGGSRTPFLQECDTTEEGSFEVEVKFSDNEEMEEAPLSSPTSVQDLNEDDYAENIGVPLSSDNSHPEDVEKYAEMAIRIFSEMGERVVAGIHSNPKVFIPAVKKLASRVSNFSTKAGLLSEIRNIGTRNNIVIGKKRRNPKES